MHIRATVTNSYIPYSQMSLSHCYLMWCLMHVHLTVFCWSKCCLQLWPVAACICPPINVRAEATVIWCSTWQMERGGHYIGQPAWIGQYWQMTVSGNDLWLPVSGNAVENTGPPLGELLTALVRSVQSAPTRQACMWNIVLDGFCKSVVVSTQAGLCGKSPMWKL